MSQHDFIVVANRLPVDRQILEDGTSEWRTSPGGLVTAMEPVMRTVESGAWIGWPGIAGEDIAPFDDAGMHLVPVRLEQSEVETYYEGYSNGTLWPLYHDVIVDPVFHRAWSDEYQRINRRFAEAAAEAVSAGGTVWVQDYQLQLVPQMLREIRPDVRIGFFLHIPFPAVELFAQLPDRKQVLRGLLGADLIGFQREADAANFLATVRRLLGHRIGRHTITVPEIGNRPARAVSAKSFPISIDSRSVGEMAEDPEVIALAKQIRKDMGSPKKVVLGVDRLDYTKGIRHRVKAYGELLDDELIDPHEVTFIQVATPSRERVEAYRTLRDELELQIGRINGDHAPIGRPAISYQHRTFDKQHMTALFRAADVVLVTALRDGMNLVAKEYVASRPDNRGVLVLSEFAGAADEMRAAIQVNPHDIDGLKAAILDALGTSSREQASRMRSMRRQVLDHDVQGWAQDFLAELTTASGDVDRPATIRMAGRDATAAAELDRRLDGFAANPRLLVACDFDGVLAPIVADRDAARALPGSMEALSDLTELEGIHVALVSGRNLENLALVSGAPSGMVLIGSHGAEVGEVPDGIQSDLLDMDRSVLTSRQRNRLARVRRHVESISGRYPGTEVETKPASVVLHTRGARGYRSGRNATLEALEYARSLHDVTVTPGKEVVEFSVVDTSKGVALETLRRASAADAVLYLGDDVTDEKAFRVLDDDDLGIKVGPGNTAASARIDAPDDVAGILRRVVAARRGQ